MRETPLQREAREAFEARRWHAHPQSRPITPLDELRRLSCPERVVVVAGGVALALAGWLIVALGLAIGGSQ